MSHKRTHSPLFFGGKRWSDATKIWATTWQNQQNGCVPSEDTDQPGHPGHPPCLIWVFSVRKKKVWVLSYPLNAQQRLWSDWVDAQADLSLRWAHTHFVGFVMSWLIWFSAPKCLIFAKFLPQEQFVGLINCNTPHKKTFIRFNMVW